MADSLLDAIRYFERFPEVTEKAAQLAINDVTRRGALKLARDEIMGEIAFDKSYLTGDRLGVTKFAKKGDLEAVITGRKRATSVARFAAKGTPVGTGPKVKMGVRVQVGRGKTTVLRSAWLVRLNKGASMTEDQYNVGLAVRLKPGESLENKHSTHKSWLVPGSVALLYGPSVDQVFATVSQQIADPVGDMVAKEFLRQFARLA